MYTWLTTSQDRRHGRVVPPATPSPAVAAVAFGQQLRARREAKQLGQEQLAHSVGISRNQLQNIEAGWSDRAKGTPSNPRLSTLLALCRELGARVVIDVSEPSGIVVRFEPDR